MQILYLLGIYLIYKIIVYVFGGISSGVKETVKTANETQVRSSVDISKSIIERNETIILEYLDTIRDDTWPHYVENRVRDCICDIANKEGQSKLAPKHREWLSVWGGRPDIPKEYLELKDYLKELFKIRFDREKAIKQKKYDEAKRMQEEKTANEGSVILERNEDLVNKFIDIAERKVSIIDDYGDENWGVLSNEITACLKKISQREGVIIDWDKQSKRSRYSYFSMPGEYRWIKNRLEEIFREYHRKAKTTLVSEENLNDFSGVEFET